MPKFFSVIFLLVLAASQLNAQTTSSEYRGHGYAFGAVGGATGSSDPLFHAGVGGERLLYKGFGIGGELGYLWVGERPDAGLGVASVDAQYHFLNASQSRKVVPFVTGGYSLLFRSGALNAVNLGGGVNYWFKERVGLRFEVRDHFPPENADAHFIGFRVGITFR
jgi:hypothetical protein